jgi:phosphomevalonate kinase
VSEVLQVSAPGKLVLLGEYAVLDGAPALVGAVDRRARVTASPAPGRWWQVAAPGLTEGPARFALDHSGALQWASDSESRGLELVERLFGRWSDAVGSAIGALPPLALELDTTEFFDDAGSGRVKLGLGSSAALTAALASALQAWIGGGVLPRPDLEWVRKVVALHRAVQGGRGSGLDVAASLLGGVLEYRLDDRQRVATARPLALPDDFCWLAVWTGRPAATGAFLERLEARRSSHRAQVEGAMAALAAAAAAGASAMERRDAGAFLDVVDASWEGFEALGAAIGMPVLSVEHRRIREIAEGCGVRYKPSGAGGGDLGLAFADDGGRLEELARRAAEAGFRLPELGIDPNGLLRSGM